MLFIRNFHIEQFLMLWGLLQVKNRLIMIYKGVIKADLITNMDVDPLENWITQRGTMLQSPHVNSDACYHLSPTAQYPASGVHTFRPG
jgi:hypothetical protein